MTKKIFLAVSLLTAITLIILAIKTTQTWICLFSLTYVVFAVAINWQAKAKIQEPSPKEKPSSPEQTILEIIKSKGKAQRHDFLEVLKMSPATLGRHLEQMEEDKLIKQVGERKGSYYVLE